MKGRAMRFAFALAASLVTIHAAAGQTANSGWRQSGYIKASSPREGNQFGHALTLSSDASTLAAGAPMESGGAGAFSAGAVYVFARTGDRWSQQANLRASNADAEDQFGFAVALSGDGNTLAVSAPFEDSGATGINGNSRDNSMPSSGAVYVFARSGGAWRQQAYIKASNTGEREDGDEFGYSIALSGDGSVLAVGAIGEDSAATGINGNAADNAASASGAVYVFTRNGSVWSQQAYLKSSVTRPNVLFGYSVSLDRTAGTLAVGEFDADRGRGAVYVFTRNGVAWSQQARLQASNGEAQDSLGCWVAISDDGNTVAAGALDEDSLLTGVQAGDQGANDQATDTSVGAAYVFSRTGTSWSQQAYIKATNTGKEDWFGVRLALSGDGNTLAVSAPNEDSAAKGINGNQNDDSAQEAGAVYVYTRTGSAWSSRAYIKPSNTDAFDEFGSSVALSRDGGMLAAGARSEDSNAKGFGGNPANNSLADSGAVYVFTTSLTQPRL